MGEFYTEQQRSLQDRFGSRPLADRLEEAIVASELDTEQIEFVGSRDYFFLSTLSSNGFPTVSYKGGGPGVVTVVDPSTLVFPSYDGNGMFLSVGNISASAPIGLLFIDFVDPNRLRVQATASISEDPALLASYPGADLVVRAEIESVWGNCPRYIHRHTRVDSNKYVPDDNGEAPFPPWKRIDLVQDALSEQDRLRAEAAGVIDFGAYRSELERDL